MALPSSLRASSMTNGKGSYHDESKIASENAEGHEIQVDMDELIEIESPMLLSPKTPSKCPLFCCFYAEFDIKKGPIICHQAPKDFMDQDISTIKTQQIHEILAKTFRELDQQHHQQQAQENAKKLHLEEIGKVDSNPLDVGKTLQDSGSAWIPLEIETESKKEQDYTTNSDKKPLLSDEIQEKGSVVTREENDQDSGQTIFEATSEFIITGELSGKIITLSTHDLHIMTRPTQIADERYERNALLFSIGFVLRRAADPRPFRPLISKLATTLRSMEVESGVLSSPTKEQKIQPLLEKILISMNSPRWECNLLLDKATALNLKLFHPPKPQASPVHQYQVPILLRRDLQLQMYEWDLAINWVIMHIDGITNARQISIKAEVDLEMVLACLRVLKHHNVIHVVDMFMYTNRYEFTEKAAAILAGKDDQLLLEAVAFAMKRPAIHVPSSHALMATGAIPSVGGQSTISGGSDTGHTESPRTGSPFRSGGTFAVPGTPSSSYPPRTLNLLAAGGSHRSTNLRFAMMAANSLERETVYLGRHQEDRKYLKEALAELYCACNRNLSFGDLWLSLTTEYPSAPALQQSRQTIWGANMSMNRPRGIGSRDYPKGAEPDGSERNDVVACSPMEASLLESMRRDRKEHHGDANNMNGNQSTKSSPNWNTIFKEFDHRRFISFGVVHGLLVRVHAYPLFSGSTFPDKRSNSLEPSAALGITVPSNNRKPINFKQEMKAERRFQLAKLVAAAMDGTQCDDEIVCRFEHPLNKLVDLVETFSGKKVIFIYSTAKSGI
jgi:hypothetical protein